VTECSCHRGAKSNFLWHASCQHITL